MKELPLSVVDFESEAIEAMPAYPPKPVGVAINDPTRRVFKSGDTCRYLAWGHPVGNNISKRDAAVILKDVYAKTTPIFHNSAFDMVVASEHMGIPMPNWDRYHDTLFEAFLFNPMASTLSLKPLWEAHTGKKAKARDELRDWILKNVPGAPAKPKKWGAHIAKAPVALVGPYAQDDTRMPLYLHEKFNKYVIKNGMQEAYDRERKLMPIIWEMEKHGIHIDLRRLKKNAWEWEKEYAVLERKVRRMLKVGKDYTLAGEDLADAIENADLLEEWVITENGARCTGVEDLREVGCDPTFLNVWERYSKFDKIITTYSRPWIEMASANGGLIYPRFNQVRNSDEYGGKFSGTRSGRLSSEKPNFQNIPRVPLSREKLIKLGKKHLLDLPNMRDFIIPDPGCVFIGRDFSQQELRILAHFVGGRLRDMYVKNPKLDLHSEAQLMIKQRTGKYGDPEDRHKIKTTGFQTIYGGGGKAIAQQVGDMTEEEGRALKKAYLKSVPGIQEEMDRLKELAANNKPLRTWGGRLYFCEAPKYNKKYKRWMTYEYKMLNYEIQPSAADHTKEAMIRVAEACKSRLALQVHDELLMCAKKGTEKREMRKLKDAMESVKFDVPILSDGKFSAKSWGTMTKWED